MPIFTISGQKDKLELISEMPFGLERELQKLVERNMETLFNLKFITSEFVLNDLRVDSLGYDGVSIIRYPRI